ncbi:two-component regulator system yiem receptor component protein [Spiroplasma sabaudiense Ar-1343]|uniref:Two-component regulator system yiem receptor component protein n=1 Tax=Spiroplasma sabaudiense Ar-1343 TaxID=1276257 RepID=W6A9Q1_9MOLU|nr:VWA domain-containing protein [Spiroplasma sabaudiense]AHI53742.1 two-component regulator system yiem receptor component protein [Spiroplasma sabaudiense Ar-1343]
MKPNTIQTEELTRLAIEKLKAEDLDNSMFKEFKAKNKSVANQFDDKINGFYNEAMESSAKTIKLPELINEEINYFHYLTPKLNSMNFVEKFSVIRKKLEQFNSTFLKKFDEIVNKILKDDLNPQIGLEDFLSAWNFMLTKRVVDFRLKSIQDLRFNYLVNVYELIKNYTNFSKAHKLLKDTFEDVTEIEDQDVIENLDTINKFSDYLYKDKSILKIAEILGRLNGEDDKFEINITEKLSYFETEVKLPYNPEEIVGITESKDLELILPAELGYLFNPALETIFFKKFSENKLQTFLFHSKEKITEEEYIDVEYEAPIPLKQGKFIICVDTSMSMEGSGEFIAKALVLAICKVALKDKREVVLINFSDDQIAEIEINPHQFPIKKILQFLAKSFYGDTNATPAFQLAIKKMYKEEWKRGDLLVISDFMVQDLSPKLRDNIKTLKENYNRFHSVFIGNSPNKDFLDIFENNMYYDPDDPNASEQIVKSLNSTLRNLDNLTPEKQEELAKIDQVNQELRLAAQGREIIKSKKKPTSKLKEDNKNGN